MKTSNPSPYVEVIQGTPCPDGSYPNHDNSASWLNKRRLIIFLSMFALGCIVSLPYNFMRPPIYESTGKLLFILPSRDIETNAKMDVQHVEIQRQVIISNPMLTKIVNHLGGEGNASNTSPIKLSHLKSMLKVIPTESLNVIKLGAYGENQELLPYLVNSWIDVYLENLNDLETSSFNSVNIGFQWQVKELGRMVAEKRQELDQFRIKYDIVSMERGENLEVVEFTGLGNSLKKAKDVKAVADAKLKAIRNTYIQGKPFVRLQDQDVITNLEDRISAIQEQLKEKERKYTPEFMKIDSQSRALAGKQELLEEKLSFKRKESLELAIAEIEQSQVTARHTVIGLERQLGAYKKKAADFSKYFAEHEAINSELAQLEQLHNESSKLLVKLEVTDRQQLPHVQVLERALMQEHPVRPYYLRDAGISIAGSFLLGLLAVWFYEFFTRPITQFAGGQRQRLSYTIFGSPKIEGPTIHKALDNQPALEQRLPRELSELEIKSLIDSANDSTQLLINTLLGGLNIDETITLRWKDINLLKGEISVSGENARNVPLSGRARTAFEHHARRHNTTVANGYVWQDKDNNPFADSDLNGLITRTAYDSKLSNPAEINTHAVRHTYIAFLIRQGVQPDEIECITGHLPPASTSLYHILLPPGKKLPLNKIETVYPALQ
ncbi:MAG: GumC family protein [Candidatus Anammoxibacter sp.]